MLGWLGLAGLAAVVASTGRTFKITHSPRRPGDLSWWTIHGLTDPWDGTPDTSLLIGIERGPYGAEIAHIKTAEKLVSKLYSALYDLYQTHDGIKKGDRFETPIGNFYTESFHVLPDEDMLLPPDEKGDRHLNPAKAAAFLQSLAAQGVKLDGCSCGRRRKRRR